MQLTPGKVTWMRLKTRTQIHVISSKPAHISLHTMTSLAASWQNLTFCGLYVKGLKLKATALCPIWLSIFGFQSQKESQEKPPFCHGFACCGLADLLSKARGAMKQNPGFLPDTEIVHCQQQWPTASTLPGSSVPMGKRYLDRCLFFF